MVIDRIDHPIAEDIWHYKLQDGRLMSSRLIVGQPTKIKDDPSGDWICPVWIEHFSRLRSANRFERAADKRAIERSVDAQGRSLVRF